jgi:hypothetical protein
MTLKTTTWAQSKKVIKKLDFLHVRQPFTEIHIVNLGNQQCRVFWAAIKNTHADGDLDFLASWFH